MADIEARENWWDDSDLAREIYDAADESGLGTVNGTCRKALYRIPLSGHGMNMPVDARVGRKY